MLSYTDILSKMNGVLQGLVILYDKLYSDIALLKCQSDKTWDHSIASDTQTEPYSGFPWNTTD